MIPSLSKSAAAAIALVGAALSASACICSNWDSAELEASVSQYEQVFAGLIIWTERSSEPQKTATASTEAPAVDPGYWIKSKVLVLRIWRGSPLMVTEVWTLVATSCDSRPIPGSYFVALAKNAAGRNVAGYSECEGPLRAFVTSRPAAFAIGGIATIGAFFGLGLIASVWLLKTIRRRKPSTERD